MNLPSGTIVAVVDGAKLNLFRNTGHLLDIQLQSVAAPAIPERLSGAPGRRSSEANPDNDTQAEDGFAMGVAEALNHMALTNKLEALMVVAAPKTLGQLRKHWHKALEERLVGEIPKDLTGRSPEAVAEAISRA
jgi:protein required for attachment to host cells